MRNSFSRLLLLPLLSAVANAGTITWYLQGSTFQSGAVATGSFAYDADTNVFSSWDITVSGSSDPVVNVHYLPANSILFSLLDVSNFQVGLGPGNPPVFTVGTFVALTFNSPLTDVGGTITLSGSVKDFV